MQVQIVTPDKSYYDGAASSAVLPAWDGEMGILPMHAPLIGRLGHGVAKVDDGGKTTRIAVYGGFVKIQNDVVTVLAGGAAAKSGTTQESQQALDTARANLETAKKAGNAVDILAAEEAANRARAFHDLMQD